MKQAFTLPWLFFSMAYVHAQTIVKDIYPGTGSSDIYNFAALGNLTLFIANDGIHGWEIWKTDGTTLGTQMVKDINTGSADGPRYDNGVGMAFSPLETMGSKVFFYANDGSSGVELWCTDGSELGTQKVTEINAVSGDILHSTMADMKAVGNQLYFKADDGTNGIELWKTDGTAAGTVLVKDINPVASANPQEMYADGNTLFFMANDNTNGFELWKTDGTTLGTVMAADIATGTASSFPLIYGRIGSNLIMFADDNVHGTELWKTDGTQSGTSMIADIFTGAPDGAFPPAILFNNRLLFVGHETGSLYYELWSTDGTLTGTSMLKNIGNGTTSGQPHDFVQLNNKVFFAAYNSVYGEELWSTDGTTMGTSLVIDINNVAANSSSPDHLTVANGNVYFRATDGTNGYEVWKTDGTNTTMLNQICAGTCSSNPYSFFKNGNTLYFLATEPASGDELYKIDLPASDVGELSDDYLTIYPNPTSGWLTIENVNPSAPIVITNLMGEILETMNGNQSIQVIDISEWPSGIYLVNHHKLVKN